MKVLLVLHIATLKGSGNRDKFQQVNNRMNWMKNQSLFSFFQFFQWSSGSEAVAEGDWPVKQGSFFGCLFLCFFFLHPSASANVGVTSPVEVFQLPFSNGERLLFLPLSCLISAKKMSRAYLDLSRQLLRKKQHCLLLLLEHRLKENGTRICA